MTENPFPRLFEPPPTAKLYEPPLDDGEDDDEEPEPSFHSVRFKTLDLLFTVAWCGLISAVVIGAVLYVGRALLF